MAELAAKVQAKTGCGESKTAGAQAGGYVKLISMDSATLKNLVEQEDRHYAKIESYYAR